jgi:hypothetical protein
MTTKRVGDLEVSHGGTLRGLKLRSHSHTKGDREMI